MSKSPTVDKPASLQVKHLFWLTAMVAASIRFFGMWGLLDGSPVRRTMLNGYISFFAFVTVALIPAVWIRAGIRTLTAE